MAEGVVFLPNDSNQQARIEVAWFGAYIQLGVNPIIPIKAETDI